MTLQEFGQKIKQWGDIPDISVRNFIPAFVLLLATMGYFAFRVVDVEAKRVHMLRIVGVPMEGDLTQEKGSMVAANEGKGAYVASRGGKAYHLPWCPGAIKIKEANKIWFGTKEEAEKAGYHAAGNCEDM